MDDNLSQMSTLSAQQEEAFAREAETTRRIRQDEPLPWNEDDLDMTAGGQGYTKVLNEWVKREEVEATPFGPRLHEIYDADMRGPMGFFEAVSPLPGGARSIAEYLPYVNMMDTAETVFGMFDVDKKLKRYMAGDKTLSLADKVQVQAYFAAQNRADQATLWGKVGQIAPSAISMAQEYYIHGKLKAWAGAKIGAAVTGTPQGAVAGSIAAFIAGTGTLTKKALENTRFTRYASKVLNTQYRGLMSQAARTLHAATPGMTDDLLAEATARQVAQNMFKAAGTKGAKGLSRQAQMLIDSKLVDAEWMTRALLDGASFAARQAKDPNVASRWSKAIWHGAKSHGWQALSMSNIVEDMVDPTIRQQLGRALGYSMTRMPLFGLERGLMNEGVDALTRLAVDGTGHNASAMAIRIGAVMENRPEVERHAAWLSFGGRVVEHMSEEFGRALGDIVPDSLKYVATRAPGAKTGRKLLESTRDSLAQHTQMGRYIRDLFEVARGTQDDYVARTSTLMTKVGDKGVRGFRDVFNRGRMDVTRNALAAENVPVLGYILAKKAVEKGWSLDATAKMFFNLGYDGVLEEMAEERVGAFLSGYFGLDGRAVEESVIPSLAEGLIAGKKSFEDWDQLKAEAIAFSLPLFTRMSIVKLQSSIGAGTLDQARRAAEAMEIHQSAISGRASLEEDGRTRAGERFNPPKGMEPLYARFRNNVEAGHLVQLDSRVVAEGIVNSAEHMTDFNTGGTMLAKTARSVLGVMGFMATGQVDMLRSNPHRYAAASVMHRMGPLMDAAYDVRQRLTHEALVEAQQAAQAEIAAGRSVEFPTELDEAARARVKERTIEWTRNAYLFVSAKDGAVVSSRNEMLDTFRQIFNTSGQGKILNEGEAEIFEFTSGKHKGEKLTADQVVEKYFGSLNQLAALNKATLRKSVGRGVEVEVDIDALEDTLTDPFMTAAFFQLKKANGLVALDLGKGKTAEDIKAEMTLVTGNSIDISRLAPSVTLLASRERSRKDYTEAEQEAVAAIAQALFSANLSTSDSMDRVREAAVNMSRVLLASYMVPRSVLAAEGGTKLGTIRMVSRDGAYIYEATRPDNTLAFFNTEDAAHEFLATVNNVRVPTVYKAQQSVHVLPYDRFKLVPGTELTTPFRGYMSGLIRQTFVDTDGAESVIESEFNTFSDEAGELRVRARRIWMQRLQDHATLAERLYRYGLKEHKAFRGSAVTLDEGKFEKVLAQNSDLTIEQLKRFNAMAEHLAERALKLQANGASVDMSAPGGVYSAEVAFNALSGRENGNVYVSMSSLGNPWGFAEDHIEGAAKNSDCTGFYLKLVEGVNEEAPLREWASFIQPFFRGLADKAEAKRATAESLGQREDVALWDTIISWRSPLEGVRRHFNYAKAIEAVSHLTNVLLLHNVSGASTGLYGKLNELANELRDLPSYPAFAKSMALVLATHHGERGLNFDTDNNTLAAKVQPIVATLSMNPELADVHKALGDYMNSRITLSDGAVPIQSPTKTASLTDYGRTNWEGAKVLLGLSDRMPQGSVIKDAVDEAMIETMTTRDEVRRVLAGEVSETERERANRQVATLVAAIGAKLDRRSPDPRVVDDVVEEMDRRAGVRAGRVINSDNAKEADPDEESNGPRDKYSDDAMSLFALDNTRYLHNVLQAVITDGSLRTASRSEVVGYLRNISADLKLAFSPQVAGRVHPLFTGRKGYNAWVAGLGRQAERAIDPTQAAALTALSAYFEAVSYEAGRKTMSVLSDFTAAGALKISRSGNRIRAIDVPFSNPADVLVESMSRRPVLKQRVLTDDRRKKLLELDQLTSVKGTDIAAYEQNSFFAKRKDRMQALYDKVATDKTVANLIREGSKAKQDQRVPSTGRYKNEVPSETFMAKVDFVKEGLAMAAEMADVAFGNAAGPMVEVFRDPLTAFNMADRLTLDQLRDLLYLDQEVYAGRLARHIANAAAHYYASGEAGEGTAEARARLRDALTFVDIAPTQLNPKTVVSQKDRASAIPFVLSFAAPRHMADDTSRKAEGDSPQRRIALVGSRLPAAMRLVADTKLRGVAEAMSQLVWGDASHVEEDLENLDRFLVYPDGTPVYSKFIDYQDGEMVRGDSATAKELIQWLQDLHTNNTDAYVRVLLNPTDKSSWYVLNVPRAVFMGDGMAGSRLRPEGADLAKSYAARHALIQSMFGMGKMDEKRSSMWTGVGSDIVLPSENGVQVGVVVMPDGTVHKFLKGGEVIGYHDVELLRDVAKGETDFGPGGAPGFKLMFSDYGRSAQFDKGRVTTAEPDAVSAVPFVNDLRREATKLAEETRSLVSLMDNDAYKLGPLLASYVSIDGKSLPEYLAQEGKSLEDEVTLTYGRTAEVDNHAEGSTETGKLSELMPMLAVRDATVAGLSVKIVTVRSDTMLVRHAAMVEHSSEESPSHLARNKLSDIDVTTHVMLQVMALNRVAAEAREDAIIELMTSPDQIARVVRLLREQDEAASSEVADLLEEGQILATDPAVLTKLASAILHRIASGAMEIRTSHPLEPNAQTVLTTKDPVTGSPVLAFSDDNTSVLLDGPATPGVEPPRVIQGPLAEFMRGARKALVLARGLVNNRTPEYRYDLSLRDTFGKGLSDRDKADAVARVLSRLFTLSAKDPNSLAVVEYYRDFVAPMFNDYDGKPLKRVVSFHDILTPEGYKHFFIDKRALPGTRHEDLRPLFNYTMFAFEEDGHGRGGRDGKFAVLGHIHSDLRVPSGIDEARGFATASSPATMVPFKKGDAYRTYEPMTLTLDELKGEVGERAATALDKALAALGSDTSSAGALAVISNWLDHGGQALLRRNYGADGISMTMRNGKPVLSFWAEVMPEEGTLVPAASAGIVQHALVTGIEGTDMDGDSTGVAVVPSSHHGLVPVLPGLTPENARLIADYGKRNTRDIRNTASSAIELEVGLRANWEDFKAIYNHGLERHTALVHGGQDYDAVYLAPDLDKGWPGLNSFIISPAAIAPGNLDIAGSKVELDLRDPAALGTNVDAAVDAAQSRGVAVSWNNVFSTAYADGLPFFLADTNGDPIEVGQLAVDKDGKPYQFEGQLLFSVDRGFSTSRADKLSQVFAKMQATKYANMFFDAVKNGTPARMNLTKEFVPLFVSMIYSRQWARHMSGQPFDVWLAEANREGVAFQRAFMQWATEVMGEMEAATENGKTPKLIDFLNARKGTPARSTMFGPVTVYQDLMRRNTEFRGHFALSRLSYAQGHNIHEANKLARALEQASPLTGDEMAAQRAVLGQLDQLYSRAPDYVRSPLVRYADYVVEESGRTVSASTRRQISSVGYRMSAAAHAARLLRARDKRVRDIARTAITQGDTTGLMRQIENILALFQARERLLVTLDKETHPVMNEFLTALRRPFFDAEGNVSGEGRVRMRFGSHLSRDLKEAAARLDQDDETPLRDAFDRWQSREGGLFGWDDVANTMLAEEYREAVANLTPRDLLTLLYLYGALTEDAAGPVPRPGAFTWALPPAYHQGLSKFRTALLEGYANEELKGYLVREAELKPYEHPKFLRSGTVVNIPSVRGTSLEGLAAKLDTYDFAKGRPLPVSREEIGREAVDRMRGFAQLSQAEARQQVTALQLRGVHVLGFPVDRLRVTAEAAKEGVDEATDTLARMILQRVNSFSPRDAILLAKDQDLEDVLGEEGIRSALRLAFGDAPVPHNLFLYAGYTPPAPQAITHSLAEVAQEPVVETPLATVAPAPVAPTTTGFLGYKGGFDGKGKGTPAGDGKDKAMRAVADSAIVELVSDRPSSSKTTIDQLGPVDENSSIVMLARNGKLRGEPLRPETVDTIRDLVSNLPGVRFVVGDMPGVDSQFIDLLRELGASFEVYHTGSSPRISIPVTPTTPTAPTASAIVEFSGANRFLSNFWPAPLDYDGIRYPTAEHAYQAAKTLDLEARARIAALPTAADAKREGKKVEMRPDWDQVKDQVMLDIVRAKFQQNPELAAKLRATGSVDLVEGNTWGDTYWGVSGGVGRNQLGKTLMTVRGEAEAPAAPPASATVEVVKLGFREKVPEGVVSGMRNGQAHMNNVPASAYGQQDSGWLGNPYYWTGNAQGKPVDNVRVFATVQGATGAFRKDFLAKVESDAAFRQAVLDLRDKGMKLGYYRPEGEGQSGLHHLQVVQEWLAGQPVETLPAAFSSVSTDLRPVDIERDGDTWTLSKGAETITESREAMIRRYRDLSTGFADKAALRAGIQGLTVQQIHEALKTRGQKSPAIMLLSALTSRNMPKFQGQEWPAGFAAESPAWSGISRRGAEGARARKEAGVLEAMDQVVRAVKLVSGNEAMQAEIDEIAGAAAKWIAELSPAEGMDSRALRALGLAVSAMSETLDPESVAAYQRISQFLASAALDSPAHSATDRQLWNLMKVDGLSPLGWISQGTNPQERFARALVFSSPDGQAHDIGAASAKALDIAKAIAGGPLVQSPEAPLSDIPADTQSFLSVGSRGQAVRVERDPVVGWMVTEVDTSISEHILPQTAKHYWNKRTVEQAPSVPMPPTASIAPRSVSPEGEVSLAFSWHDALVAIPARVKAQQTLAQQLKRINAPKVEAEAFLKWAEGKDGDSVELLEAYEAEVLPKLEIVGARVWPEGHEHDIASSSAYENLSVNQGQGTYKEYYIRTPFPVPGQHGEFQDPNLAGWFRVREHADGTLEVQEIQSELFQKNKGGFDFGPADVEPAEPDWSRVQDRDAALARIEAANYGGFTEQQADFLNLMLKDQTWVSVFINAITQWARNQGFSPNKTPFDGSLVKEPVFHRGGHGLAAFSETASRGTGLGGRKDGPGIYFSATEEQDEAYNSILTGRDAPSEGYRAYIDLKNPKRVRAVAKLRRWTDAAGRNLVQITPEYDVTEVVPAGEADGTIIELVSPAYSTFSYPQDGVVSYPETIETEYRVDSGKQVRLITRTQGFTKVRFPTGETAAKVKGHQVLADRLTALQEERAWWIEGARQSASELHRIDEFTRKLDDGTSIFYSRNPAGVWGFRFADETRAQNDDLSEEKVLSALAHPTAQVLRSRDLEAVDAEIQNLKTQGIEKLAPIEAFYERRVAAIVNRMGAQLVTDANGNTWREVNLAKSLDAGVLTASLPYQFSDPRWEQFSVDGFNYRFNKGEGQLERAVEGSDSWAKVDMAFYNDAIAKADPSITEDIVSPASAPDVQSVGDDPELLASLLANEQVPEGFVDVDDVPAPAQVTVTPSKPPALTVPELRKLRHKLRELGVFEEFWGTPGGSVDTGSSYGVASARGIVAGSPEAQQYAQFKTNPVLLRQGTEVLQALADHFGVQDLFHPRVVAAVIQLFKHSAVDAGLLGKFAPPAEERGGNLGLRDLTGLASLAVNRMVGDLQSLDTDRLSPRFYDPAPGDASGFHQAGRARSKLPQWAAMHPTDDLLSSGVTGSEILALFDAVNIALLELRKRAAQSPDVTPDDVNPEGDDYDTPDLPDLPTSADIYEPLNKTYRAHITPYSTWIQESVLPTLGIANLRELATDGTSEAALLGTRQKIAYLRRFWGMGQSGAIPVLMEAQAPTFVTDPSRPGEISDETRTVSSVERTGFGIKGLSFTDDERILTAWVASTALADASGSDVVLIGAEADFSDTPDTKNGRNAVDWRAVPTSELPPASSGERRTFNVNKMLQKAKVSLPVEVYEAWLGAFDDVMRVALNNFSHDPATMKDTKPVEFNRHVLRALAEAKLVSISEGNGLDTSSATLTVPVDMVEKIFKGSSARDKLVRAGRKESELSVKQLSKAVREVIKEAEKAIYDNRGWLGNAFGRSVSGLGGLAPFIPGHGAYRRFFEYADESPKSYEEAILATRKSLQDTIAKESERPEAERRGAYEASPRMKAYIASLYGVTFQQIDEALRGKPDLTIDGVREMVRQMRSAAQRRGQANYKDIDVNLLAYTDVAHALAYKAIEVINRNVSDPAAKRDNLADAAAALAAAREVARSRNTSVNFSHREMWENFGILPEGRHDIFSSTLAWSDRIATAMRWREAFVAMLAAKDSNGDHVLVAVPNMEVQDAADMLPDELWGALAKSWAQSLAKRGLKGPAYDPAKTGQENAKIIADSYTAIASGSRNRMGRMRRGVQDDYRVIEVGGAAPVSRMYARRDTDEDSSPLLNSMVGGTAAGYATRMLHTLGMQDIHPTLRAAQAAVGWTRMLNMAFSGFFAFATGVESMIASSGLSGVLWNVAPRAFRRRAARGERSLASLPLIGAIMGDDIKNMTATARDFMPLLRSNDPQIVELRQIAHALGISTGQDAMAKIFDTGSAHGDMERVALHIRKTMGRAAEKAFRKTSRIAFEAIPEATFEYLLEATTLAALHNFIERMRAEAEARGKIFEPWEHMQKAARYIQAEFGPIDHAVYPWLTPKGYAAASTIFMSLQWTMGALEAAGAGTILHKITGHEFAPEVRKFMLWRWARMLSVVIYGLPALAQVLARGIGLALGVDDDDEGKWFMWNNEIGRRTHADITPFLLGLAKLPGNKFLQDLPVVGKFVPGYRDEQTTGRRRYYMRWGKQGYEVGTLLVEGDATRYFIGKLSSPASGMLEHAFGRNLAMDWELPFKDQNIVSSLFHGSDGFKDSATVNYLKKILPFSFAGALSGPVDNEAGILSALGPVSKGVNAKTLTAMMEDRLRKWADRGSPEARHLRVPLGHLVSDLARMGYDNGYDGVKIAKRASINVANRYYQDVFANAPGNPSGKVDLDRMGEALDALARLSRGLDGISRSMQNRDSQLNKLPGVETWRQRRQAIDTAFRRDKRRSAKWDPRDFNQAALGGNVSDALDTDTLPEKILGYAVAHPSQLTPEDHQYFQDNPQAGGYFEQSLDPKGASTVTSSTDFLDSDELPETVLGYPVLRPEALTDEDLEYFRDYPAAAGFFDSQPTGE